MGVRPTTNVIGYAGLVDAVPFLFDSPWRERRVRQLMRRLPPLAGAPIRLQAAPGLQDRYGAVHAGSFLRERRIAFACSPAEFTRIFVHEVFHFVWLRLGNPLRREWERNLSLEFQAGARGELGWSAERRKQKLWPADLDGRTRRWREYVCESFCDTAAFLYSGCAHPEFTLAARHRNTRRQWFEAAVGRSHLSI